jgi:hypothetical protein
LPKSLPKSPERLPVENADATLEELEALPNGEALRIDTIVSGIAAALLQGPKPSNPNPFRFGTFSCSSSH